MKLKLKLSKLHTLSLQYCMVALSHISLADGGGGGGGGGLGVRKFEPSSHCGNVYFCVTRLVLIPSLSLSLSLYIYLYIY